MKDGGIGVIFVSGVITIALIATLTAKGSTATKGLATLGNVGTNALSTAMGNKPTTVQGQ